MTRKSCGHDKVDPVAPETVVSQNGREAAQENFQSGYLARFAYAVTIEKFRGAVCLRIESLPTYRHCYASLQLALVGGAVPLVSAVPYLQVTSESSPC